MNLKQLQDDLAALAAERGQGAQQNPKNLAMAVAADAGALLALFRWLTEEQSWRLGGNGEKEAAAGALADVLVHALRLADELGIDLEAAVQTRLAPQAPAREAKPAPRAAPSRPVETFVVPATPPPPAAPAVVAPPAPIEAPKPVEIPAVEEPATAADPVEAIRIEELPAPPPEPNAAPKEAPPVEAPVPKKDRKPAADATPSWLDGLIPARTPGRGKKAGSEAKPAAAEPKAAPSPTAPAADATAAEESTSAADAADAAPEPVAVAAAPPPAPAPKREPARPPAKERHAALDPEATKTLVRALARRVDGSRSDDPLLRELHDELETLRRALYSPNPKRSWLADSLTTIRNLLEETAQHAVGAELHAEEHIAQIERILGA
jgi:NTP pyrophosphatase (non-canonical NTP hydrolase)